MLQILPAVRSNCRSRFGRHFCLLAAVLGLGLALPGRALAQASISGTVFEDVNYGGGVGRTYTAANTSATASGFVSGSIARPGATVELYDNTGAFLSSTTSSSTGAYTFTGLAASSYTVRVVNSTVTSTRTGGTTAGLLPVQTFRTSAGGADANRVGGESPAQADTPANSSTVVTNSTSANNIALTFQGLNSTGDNTLFLDNVQVLQNGTALTTNPIGNPGFESGTLTDNRGTYQYNPNPATITGLVWTFNAQSGIQTNNSTFTPPNTASGSRAALIQSTAGANGQLSQTFTLPAGTYTLRFSAANRITGGQQAVRVSVNGTTILANLQAVAGTYASYQTAAFSVATAAVAGANNLSSFVAQSLAPVTTTANTATTGIDFGFNFSTVVNANDAGQGSLRQLVLNANALGDKAKLAQAGSRLDAFGTTAAPALPLPTGQETSIFMISDGQPHSGLRSGLASGLAGSASTNKWALIALSTGPLTPTAAGTILDGTTQTVNVSDSNPGQVGSGGPGSSYATVGTGALVFNKFSRPEVEVYALNTAAATTDVVVPGASNLTIRGFALHGGANTVTASGVTGFLLENNLIGTTAYVINDPQLVTANSAATFGVWLSGATLQATVRRNVVAYSNNSGIYLPSGATATGSDVLLAGNELVQNGYRQSGGDNITVGDAGNAGPVRVVGNLLRTSNSDGLQFELGQVGVGGTGRNVVRNNTFFDNGNGGVSISRTQYEGAAVLYLQRGGRTGTNADSIYFNIINQTQAGGVVIGYGQRGVIVSRNSTFFNGTPFNSPTGGNLGIDLITQPSYYVGSSDVIGARDYGNGDGVTPNAGAVNNAFGNAGMNYPIFTLAAAAATASATVNVQGYVGSASGQSAFAGAIVEIYTADNVPANNNGNTVSGDGRRDPHGEGRTYLGTVTCDGSGNFTGQLTVPAGSPPLSGTAITGFLTATAYLPAYGTSEFGPNRPIIVAADVQALITGNGPVNAGAQGTFTVTFSNPKLTGPVQAENVVATVQLPPGLSNVTFPSGTAGTYNATTGLVTYSAYSSGSAGSLAPDASFSSTISYTQPAAAPVTATATISTTTNEGGQTANNTATTTNLTNLLYDVTTAISGPATATAGNQVAYVVTTSNLGSVALPSPAPNVGQTVTVPAGATNLFATGNGVVTGSVGAGYTVTFPNVPGLAAGQSVSHTVSFTAPNGAYSVGAAVKAPNDNVTTNNSASALTTINAGSGNPANVFVTIAPASADVAPGASGSFTLTQGNAGPNPATGVLITALLPPGLTGVTVTNGGTTVSGAYNSTTGLVTLPTVASQVPGAASNQSYTIGFTAPAGGKVVTATAAVLTTSPDNIPADNTATALITVPASADLVTQLSGPTTALVGQSLTYTMITSNNGPRLATTVSQTLNLPAGLLTGGSPLLLNGNAPTSVSGTVASYGNGAAAITYDAASGRLTLPTLASLAAGANTAPLTVSYPAPANGSVSLSATAAVISASPDGNLANNIVSLTTALVPAVDVQVILTGAGQTQPGSLITYGVTTFNNGPSTAPSVGTTVSLPSGLTTVQINGQAATSVSGGVYTYPGGATYDSNNSSVSPTTSGVVTFPALTNLTAGPASAAVNTISFVLPAGYQGTLTTTATATVSGITDFLPSNNTSTVQPRIAPVGSTSNDLQVALALGAGTGSTVAAGSPINLTLTLTSPSAGSSVLPFVQLVPGLTSGTGTVVASLGGTAVGASYDNVSGLLTLPAILNTTAGQVLSYTIAISQAPGSGPLVARASATGNETDANLNNNLAAQSLAITPTVTLAATVSGPASVPPGSVVSYLISSTETGPSAATGPVQTVTIPTGATNLVVNGVATTVPGNGVITLPLPAVLLPGSANTVTNTVSFTAPGAAGSSFAVTGNLSFTSSGTTAVATASQSTAIASPAPIARNLVNTLQAPEGTTAAAPLPITVLSAVAQGTAGLASHTVVSLPLASQGILYLNNGSNTAITVGQVLSLTDSNKLRFQPAPGFVGNATFSYLTTDNTGTVSNTALYLVPVGPDANSFYTPATAKTGYQNNDVLAFVTDPNGALYTSAGQLYSASTGQLVNSGTGVSNGLPTAGINAVLATTGPSQNPGNALPAGVSFNQATGQLYVSNRTQLPVTAAPTTYYLNVVTTDLYGGTNTVLAQFTFSANPLPVSLVQFVAQAQGRDARLSWTTASEQDNDYFAIERSFDGVSFAAIGRQAGQASKATATTYAYRDANAAAQASGPVYYRLRQVDLNGTSTYSPVRVASFGPASLSLYPNPAGATAQLDLRSLPAGPYRLVLTDPLGRTVREASYEGGFLHTLDLRELAAGTYQARLTGTGSTGAAVNFTQRLGKL